MRQTDRQCWLLHVRSRVLVSCGKMVADSSDMERTPWDDERWPVVCAQGTDDLRLKTWKQAGTKAEANRGTTTSTCTPLLRTCANVTTIA